MILARTVVIISLIASNVFHCECSGLSRKAHELPNSPLIVGYQSWGACNETQTVAAVEEGVNVVIWFAINLVKDEFTQKAKITSGPHPSCVAKVRKAIELRGLPTTHLISIGGWDAPHPDISFSGAEWFQAWNDWNSNLAVPFDGFDWDLEGNDVDRTQFKPEVLNIVVDMSTRAKSAGYIVTMVPAQSYLDPTTSLFSTSASLAYADWHPEADWHGYNIYAYIIAAMQPLTFDMIAVQLYETWSRAHQALLQKGVPGDVYLESWTAQMLAGWVVDFGYHPQLRVNGKVKIQLQQDQLVIGIGFGSRNGKSAYFSPDTLALAYNAADKSLRPRGYSFWSIASNGGPANGTETKVNFASALNTFLHVRDSKPAALMRGAISRHVQGVVVESNAATHSK